MNPRCPLNLVLAALLVFPLMTACREDNTELLRQSRQLALSFHSAVIELDIDKLSDLVVFPFHLDNDVVIKDRAQFKKVLSKKIGGMQKRMLAARKTEAVTWSDFIDGHAIRGKELKGEAAKKQAKKLNFVAGDVLVRCYSVDASGKQDGRDYFIVLRKNDLGDLKVHTYFD